MYWNYRKKIHLGTSSCVLYTEIVLISECPLSEIPLYAMQNQLSSSVRALIVSKLHTLSSRFIGRLHAW